MSDKTKIKSIVKVTILNVLKKAIDKCTNVISIDELCALDEKSEESNK